MRGVLFIFTLFLDQSQNVLKPVFQFFVILIGHVTPVRVNGETADDVVSYGLFHFYRLELICLMRSPIQRMTGTAIELPQAAYLSPSGQSSSGLPRQGILDQLSGKP